MAERQNIKSSCDIMAKLEVFIMLESKKQKGLMDAFYQEFKDTDIFLKRQPKK